MSSHYVMGQDIDLKNKYFSPISKIFTGNFDGRGKKIINLAINVTGNAALFLNLGTDGIIKNLGIERANVRVNVIGPIGSLAGTFGCL